MGVIYLQGGTKDTGAFRQMVGTHQNYEIEHKLSSVIIKEKKTMKKQLFVIIWDYY